MRVPDVAEAVRIHVRAFPRFFLSFLGPRFLDALYRGIVADPSGVALVVEDSRGPIGFAAGTTTPSGFYSRLIRRSAWRFALAALPAALGNPRIVPRLLRALTMPAQAGRWQEGALLLSIAVDPGGQGTGAGRALAEGFVYECGRRGARLVFLTTDRFDNDRVNRFYVRMGFCLSRTFRTAEGREMNEYVCPAQAEREEAPR